MSTITVYSKPNCQPCGAVKRWLAKEGIEYQELDAMEHVDLLSGMGYRGAPVVVAGDIHFQGFDPNMLKKIAG